MKSQHLIILFIVLLGLFGLVKGLEYINQDKGKTIVEDFLHITSEQVDKIELASPTETNILEKTNTGWQLTSPLIYKANATNVQTLLSKLDDFKTDNVISSNPENQDTFEVNDQKGTRVTLSGQGEQLASFYVGKVAADYNHTYVRQVDEDEIKTARGSLKTTFGRKTIDWRDKTIYSYDKATITGLTIIAKGSAPYSLSPDSTGTWQIQGQTDVQLDSTKIQTLLNSAAAMNCTNFIDDPGAVELNFNEPDLQIVSNIGTDTLIVNLILKDAVYYARLPGNDQIFIIAKYAFDNLNKQPVDLLVTDTTGE